MTRMRGRRRAVEDQWVQSEKKAIDDLRLDPGLFEPRAWWMPEGRAHKLMVVFRDSKPMFFFALVMAFFCVYFISWLILSALGR